MQIRKVIVLSASKQTVTHDIVALKIKDIRNGPASAFLFNTKLFLIFIYFLNY